MEGSEDYLPRNWEARAVWHANWMNTLPTVAAKYGVSAAYLAQVIEDNAWLQYWVQAKLAAKMQEKQLTDYVDDTFKEPIGAPQPLEPELGLPPSKPRAIPPGMRQRIREAVNLIKDQKSIYTESDGEMLGIEPVKPDKPVNPAPVFSLETMANFVVKAVFTKKGFDSIRFEYRHKGAAWQLAAVFTVSPGEFAVAPLAAGVAEQIEVRAIYLEKNQPTGSYSDIKIVLIAP